MEIVKSKDNIDWELAGQLQHYLTEAENEGNELSPNASINNNNRNNNNHNDNNNNNSRSNNNIAKTVEDENPATDGTPVESSFAFASMNSVETIVGPYSANNTAELSASLMEDFFPQNNVVRPQINYPESEQPEFFV
jgi:hypothetical protein